MLYIFLFAQQQGYASEAVRALIHWALAQPGVSRIVAACSADNAPSVRILEKLGMRRLDGRQLVEMGT